VAREPQATFGKKTALALGAAFVLSVFLPLASSWTGWPEELSNFEKRELAPRPELLHEGEDGSSDSPAGLVASLDAIERFPHDYELWYDDHFGLRSRLIRAHNILESRLLRTPPNDEVVIGRDGWLYFAGQLNIEQYRALTPMPPELVAGWKRYLTIVREWVEDLGARYLLVIGPSKPTIHPEHVPGTIRRVGRTTRLDQLTTELEAGGRQWFLDLRGALLEAKREHPTYQKTDTHWNSWGSLVATRAVIDELRGGGFGRLTPLSLDDYSFHSREQAGGDIAELMGLSDLFTERDRVYEPKEPQPFAWTTEGLPPGLHPFHEPYAAQHVPARLPPGGLPRVVVFHDSFGPYLADFLPRFFARAVFYWQYQPSLEAVVQEGPDLVLQEVGERVLIRDELKGGDVPFPLDERIRADFERRRAFRRATRSVFQSTDPGVSEITVAGGLAGSEHALVRLDLDVPRGCTAGLSSSPVRRRLFPGHNVVYLELASDAAGLVFEPADAGARVRSLEARIVGSGAPG